jgi:hypothetical protein
LIAEIDAKEFVEWLLRLPAKKRIRPMQSDEITAVARRLGELAISQPESNVLTGLATDVWKQLLLRVPDGRVATNSECVRFLEEYAPCFLNHDVKAAIAAIQKGTVAQGTHVRRKPNQIEYVIEDRVLLVPSAERRTRTGGRPPADDRSERIGVAVDAMTKAECSRPIAIVTDSMKRSGRFLKEYCTIPHVTSRSKSTRIWLPLSKQQMCDNWHRIYWYTLHPEHVSIPDTDPEWVERFVFTKCDC